MILERRTQHTNAEQTRPTPKSPFQGIFLYGFAKFTLDFNVELGYFCSIPQKMETNQEAFISLFFFCKGLLYLQGLCQTWKLGGNSLCFQWKTLEDTQETHTKI